MSIERLQEEVKFRVSLKRSIMKFEKDLKEKYGDKEMCLDSIDKDSENHKYVSLQFVKNQTEAICFAATRQNGKARAHYRNSSAK